MVSGYGYFIRSRTYDLGFVPLKYDLIFLICPRSQKIVLSLYRSYIRFEWVVCFSVPLLPNSLFSINWLQLKLFLVCYLNRLLLKVVGSFFTKLCVETYKNFVFYLQYFTFNMLVFMLLSFNIWTTYLSNYLISTASYLNHFHFCLVALTGLDFPFLYLNDGRTGSLLLVHQSGTLYLKIIRSLEDEDRLRRLPGSRRTVPRWRHRNPSRSWSNVTEGFKLPQRVKRSQRGERVEVSLRSGDPLVGRHRSPPLLRRRKTRRCREKDIRNTHYLEQNTRKVDSRGVRDRDTKHLSSTSDSQFTYCVLLYREGVTTTGFSLCIPPLVHWLIKDEIQIKETK